MRREQKQQQDLPVCNSEGHAAVGPSRPANGAESVLLADIRAQNEQTIEAMSPEEIAEVTYYSVAHTQ